MPPPPASRPERCRAWALNNNHSIAIPINPYYVFLVLSRGRKKPPQSEHLGTVEGERVEALRAPEGSGYVSDGSTIPDNKGATSEDEDSDVEVVEEQAEKSRANRAPRWEPNGSDPPAWEGASIFNGPN